MLNTQSSTRRLARPGRTRRGAVAGLMIGGVLLGGGTLVTGCSSSASSSATSSGTAAQAAGQPAGQGAFAGPAMAPTASGAARSNPGALRGAATTARLVPAASIIYTAEMTVRAGN